MQFSGIPNLKDCHFSPNSPFQKGSTKRAKPLKIKVGSCMFIGSRIIGTLELISWVISAISVLIMVHGELRPEKSKI